MNTCWRNFFNLQSLSSTLTQKIWKFLYWTQFKGLTLTQIRIRIGLKHRIRIQIRIRKNRSDPQHWFRVRNRKHTIKNKKFTLGLPGRRPARGRGGRPGAGWGRDNRPGTPADSHALPPSHKQKINQADNEQGWRIRIHFMRIRIPGFWNDCGSKFRAFLCFFRWYE